LLRLSRRYLTRQVRIRILRYMTTPTRTPSLPPLRRWRHLPPVALLTLAFSGYAGAFECWTNSDGVRECGDAVPPEYAQQQVESLDSRGITREIRPRAKTAEELETERRAAEEAARREAEAERKAREQAAHDEMLLKTFVSEEDIRAARDRKLSAIDATIGLTRITINKLEERLATLGKRAANLERSGREIPQELLREMDTVEKQIEEKENHIRRQEAEKARLADRYARDMERFRTLMEARGR